ncbi:MAG TPA: GerMN domain-containing protein [Desulfuromonadaceae bacterium]
MKNVLILALTFIFMLFTVGCTKKEVPASAKPARVSATKAYETYFGPAPTTDKGTCFAFVIYFPSAKEPGKVVPFPFFTFDAATIEKVAVERLLGGMDIDGYRGEFLQPFTPGAHIVALSQKNGIVEVDLGRDFLTSGATKEGMLHALVMTLAQFKGVTGVRLLSEGKAPDYAPAPLLPVTSAVLDPGPPRLLSVTAVKEKGAKEVAEVSAYFDRPVEIKGLNMTDPGGKPFAGELFQSVFDMAAVLKPKDPGQFTAGQRIRVRWKVADKLGRQAEGEDVRPLEIKEHEH